MTMLGVDHVGVGVTDVDAARRFYGDLGFTEVAFDREGPLPGLERVAGREGVEARILVLRNPQASALGLGSVKLVQVTDRPVPPMPEGLAWGERGICEICVHVRGEEALYQHLTQELGHPGLMDSNHAVLPPHGTRTSLSYVADPDGGKIELLEWYDLDAGWPSADGPQGVNHVAFGVADLDRTRAFYEGLGFGGLVFESDGYFEPMHPWYPGEPPRQKMLLLTNPHGAGMEPVEHVPASADMRGDWGHAGPMEFAIGVRNIDLAVRELERRGIEVLSAPQTIEDPNGGVWRYAYFVEPDGLFVSLCETRY